MITTLLMGLTLLSILPNLALPFQSTQPASLLSGRYLSGTLNLFSCYNGNANPLSLFVELNTCIPLDVENRLLRYQIFFIDTTDHVLTNIYGFPSMAACLDYEIGSSEPGCCIPQTWKYPSQITHNCSYQSAFSYGFNAFPGKTYYEASMDNTFLYTNLTYADISYGPSDDICAGEPIGGTFVGIGSCFQDPAGMYLNTGTKYGFDFYQITTAECKLLSPIHIFSNTVIVILEYVTFTIGFFAAIVGYYIDDNGEDASSFCSNILRGQVKLSAFSKASNLTAKEWNCTDHSIFYSTGFKNRGEYMFSHPLPSPYPMSAPKSCFSGAETVLLESLVRTPISKVRIGDRILAAEKNGVLSFASVVAIPHLENYIRSEFVHIITEIGGADIRMTHDHLIPFSCTCTTSDFVLTKATDVVIGGCIMSTQGKVMVTSTDVVDGIGLYSVVTTAEFIVVNEIITSPFAINHVAADSFYDIFRFLFSYFPMLISSRSFRTKFEYFTELILSSAW